MSGDDDGAIAVYDALLKKSPTNVHAHFNVALSLQKLGKNDAAIDALRKAVQFDPSNAKYQRALAQALQRSGDRQGAIGVYRRMIDQRTDGAGRTTIWESC